MNPSRDRDGRPAILLTGATGMVGGAVVRTLAANERYEVHAVARNLATAPAGVVARRVDLNDPGFSRKLADTEYDAIIHCAQPRADERRGAADDFDLKVVRGLEALCTTGTRRLLYTSGVWIYGHQPPGHVIREDSPLRPITHAKDRLRTLSHLRHASGHRWVEVVLPSLVYGRGPLRATADGVQSGAAMVLDDESIGWSLIEQTDAGEAYRCLLEANYRERIFLVAEVDLVPIIRLHRLIADHLSVPFAGVSRERLQRALSKEDFETVTVNQPVDSSLIRRRTGWRNRHVFTDGHRKLLETL